MSLARLSVNNPVPVNLLMVAVIVSGTLAYLHLPKELMPDLSFNWAFVIKIYPGVSAEEIEKLITVPIEDAVRDVDGVSNVSSQSAEGRSFVFVKFEEMTDDEFRTRFQDLRTEVEKINDFPEDALDTEFRSFSSADFMPLIAVHLYGQTLRQRF